MSFQVTQWHQVFLMCTQPAKEIIQETANKFQAQNATMSNVHTQKHAH